MTNDKDMLSQDEIDALLAIGDETEEDDEEVETEDIKVSDYLTTIEADTLGEIGNISIGSSATTLSTLLNHKVKITTPTISIIKKPELNKSFSYEHVHVQVNYIEGFTGQNIFVIQTEDASVMSDIMLGGDGTNPDEELNDIHLSAVQEVMNQMMGSAATSMSTIFNKRVNISPPTIELRDAQEEEFAEEIDEEVFVKVSFQLQVGDLIDSSIMQLIPFPFAYDLVEELLQSSQTKEEDLQAEENKQSSTSIDATGKKERFMEQEQQTVEAKKPQQIGHSAQGQETVQEATFSEFEHVDLNPSEQRNLDILLDVPLKITVELGRIKRPIKDILDLTAGSIIELDKLAGEPVDVFANDKLIAKGEVVVIDENFGVRITDIMSQSARIKSLQ